MKYYSIRIVGALCFLLICPFSQSLATDYYLATYDEIAEGLPHDVNVKKIDLESAFVVGNVTLRHGGSLWNEKPLIIDVQSHKYFLFAIETGVYAKNSGPGAETTFVFIINDSLDITRGQHFSNASIDHFEQFADDGGFRFELRAANDTATIFRRGIYNLDVNFQPRRIRDFITGLGTGDIRELDQFEYLHRLNNNPDNIFYSVMSGGVFYLLKLNSDNTIIVSSITASRRFASDIFAFHQDTQLLYLFHLNYEQHGKFPEYEKNYGEDWIEPHVLIYNPANFELVDSLPIADFSPGNYPLSESGQGDVVGDFIVYYFFEDEWIGRFNPAMLFIFDTRTNEATWLRVGWR